MKLDEFCAELKKKGIDAAVLLSSANKDENIDYLAGFNREHCLLVIRPRARIKARLFVPLLEFWAAKKTSRVKVCLFNKSSV